MQVNPKIMSLVEALGAQVRPMDKLPKNYGEIMPGIKGCYNGKLDMIAIRTDMSGCETNLVLLHELVHWTGHSSRLSRISIVYSEHDMIWRSPVDYAVEEIIAQVGALKLHNMLGVCGCPQALSFTKQYTYTWAKTYSMQAAFFNAKPLDMKQCEAKALESVDWMLKKFIAANEHRLSA